MLQVPFFHSPFFRSSPLLLNILHSSHPLFSSFVRRFVNVHSTKRFGTVSRPGRSAWCFWNPEVHHQQWLCALFKT
jgi:hypothetical protein